MSRRQETGYSSEGNATEEHQTGRWTAEEHERFLVGLRKHNKQWKLIADLIRTRTVVQVRTHAQKHFQKLARQKAQSKSDGSTQSNYDSPNESGNSSKSSFSNNIALSSSYDTTEDKHFAINVHTSTESTPRTLPLVVPPSPKENLYSGQKMGLQPEYAESRPYFGFDGMDFNSAPGQMFGRDTYSHQLQMNTAVLARRCYSSRSFSGTHFSHSHQGYPDDIYEYFSQPSSLVHLADQKPAMPIISSSSSGVSWVDIGDFHDSSTYSGRDGLRAESDFENTEGFLDFDFPFSDDMLVVDDSINSSRQLSSHQFAECSMDDYSIDNLVFESGIDLNSLEPLPLTHHSSNFDEDCDDDSIVNCFLNNPSVRAS